MHLLCSILHMNSVSFSNSLSPRAEGASVVAQHPHIHVILPSKDSYSASVGLGRKPRAQLSGLGVRFVPQEITTNTTTAMRYRLFGYSVRAILHGPAVLREKDELKGLFPPPPHLVQLF